jgi:hypothetical protein
MENLKKNLHFVVFGAGVLLGIIFLGVGMYIRSGTEADLATEQTNLSALAKPGAVPTKGNLDKAEELSGRFDASLTTAENLLTGSPGTLFTSNYSAWNDGRQFFSEEANAKLTQLKARFEAMKKPLMLPALLKGWDFAMTSARATPWTQLDQDMSNPAGDKIREMQMRLRVLDEVATTIEKLLDTGAGDGFGVTLVSIKFPTSFGPISNSETDSPWLALAAEFELECSPGFAILLAEELANPSRRTFTPADARDPKKTGSERIGFPVLVDMLQTVMIGRQQEMRAHILNEDKPDVLAAVNEAMKAGEPRLPVPPDPKAIDPEKPDGKDLIEATRKNLNDQDRLVLPVQVGLKMKAVAFNGNWRAVKKEETENQ